MVNVNELVGKKCILNHDAVIFKQHLRGSMGIIERVDEYHMFINVLDDNLKVISSQVCPSAEYEKYITLLPLEGDSTYMLLGFFPGII